MDKEYAQRILERLQAERSVHDEKFASNPLHKHCLQRFDKAISAIKKELGETDEPPRLDFATSESALPDALFPARKFIDTADEMASDGDADSAQLMHRKAIEIVMDELNELDGFAF